MDENRNINGLSVNRTDIAALLSILGEREFYCVFAKNHKTDEKETKWLTKSEVADYTEKMNNLGFQVWISVNDKEKDKDSIDGVTRLCGIVLDVDAKREDKNVPATTEELDASLKEAVKLKEFLEEKYKVRVFICCSGNGWHLTIIFTPFSLPTVEARRDFNEKLHNFFLQVEKESGVEFDHTSDLRRMTTLVGSFNLKIPDKPLPTSWYTQFTEEDLKLAREQSNQLLTLLLTLPSPHIKRDKVPSPIPTRPDWSKVRVCFKKVLDDKVHLPDKNGHQMMLSTAAELKAAGFSEDRIVELFSHFTGFDEKECRSQVSSADPTKTALCVTVHQLGYCLPDCSLNTFITQEIWDVSQNPHLLAYILKDLQKRVKRDLSAKLLVLLTGISAYGRDPINAGLTGETSIGKTYNVVETLKYFPGEDVWLLMGMSKKSLFHERGVLIGSDGKPLGKCPQKPKLHSYPSDKDGKAEYKRAVENYFTELTEWEERREGSYVLISLWNKILVFLTPPDEEFLKMLYPLSSHDKERMVYKFTDPETLKTTTVVLEGWPAMFFLSTKPSYIAEQVSRLITTSPESSAEKIGEANELTNLQWSYPERVEGETEETKKIKALIVAIKRQAMKGKLDVKIPFPDLWSIFPKEIVTDMRHFKHFGQLGKAVTLLHMFQRLVEKGKEKSRIISNVDDLMLTFAIFNRVFETTRTGLQQNILNFYYDIIQTKTEWSTKELVEEYTRKYKKRITGSTLREKLRALHGIDYVEILPNPEDETYNIYKPKKFDEEGEGNTGLFQDTLKLRLKLEESFDSWLIQQRNSAWEFLLKNKFLNGYLTFEEIHDTALIASIIKNNSFRGISGTEFLCWYKELLLLKDEKKSEDRRSGENPVIPSLLPKKLPTTLTEVPIEPKILDGPWHGTCNLCHKEKDDLYTTTLGTMCYSCFKKESEK